MLNQKSSFLRNENWNLRMFLGPRFIIHRKIFSLSMYSIIEFNHWESIPQKERKHYHQINRLTACSYYKSFSITGWLIILCDMNLLLACKMIMPPQCFLRRLTNFWYMMKWNQEVLNGFRALSILICISLYL